MFTMKRCSLIRGVHYERCHCTFPLSTSNLLSTQCVVIPSGELCKYEAFQRYFIFNYCVSIVNIHPQCCANRFFPVRKLHYRDWREARLRHCAGPLQLRNRPPYVSLAAPKSITRMTSPYLLNLLSACSKKLW